MVTRFKFSLGFICCFLMLITARATAGINDIEIRVLPESIVYDEYYTLGDIAELDGFDIETIQKLARLQVGKSPLPGHSLLVSHGMIRRKINNFGSKREFKLNLPSKPMVSRASIKVTKEQLYELADKEIRSQYEGYDQVKITVKTKLKDIYLPKGKISYEMKRIGNKVRIGGYSTWSLSLLTNREEIKKVYVRAKVEVFDEVFVAKGKIRKGEKIAKADLTTITKNISGERVGYAAESDILVGKQAKRDILENESLKKNLVEKPVLIKKGAPIKLIYKTKNLFLTNIVKALKEGKKGDVIPVRPLTGKKTIYAVVIDENSVGVAL